MTHLLLIALTLAILLFYYFLVNGGRPVPSAPNWFMLINLMLLAGTLQVVNLRDPIAFEATLRQALGLLTFVVGAWLVNLQLGTTPTRQIRSFLSRPLLFDLAGGLWRTVTVPLLVVALLVSAVFAYSLGYHVLLDQLTLSLGPGAAEQLQSFYSTSRTEAHYGERYLFVGYVTQFKDILLPLLTAFFVVRAQRRGGLTNWLASGLLVIVNLYLLTVTGRRAPAIFFVLLLCLVAATRWAVIRRPAALLSRSRLLLAGIVAGGSAAVASVTAIRSEQSTSGFGDLLLTTVSDLWGRMGPRLASEKLALARLLDQRPATWGRDWVDRLATIAPGHEGGIVNEFHAALYGGRGAVGLTIWDSLWMNFRWWGVVVGGLAAGVLLQWVTLRSWTGARFASKHVVLLFLSFHLALTTDPYSLVNNGVLTIVLLYGLLVLARDHAVPPASTGP